MPTRLQLTQNAQFFVPKDEVTDESIQAILDAASANQIPDERATDFGLRTNREIAGTGEAYRFSGKVFRTERQVYFFDGDLSDTIYAYIAIFEIDNHVVILKKSCANTADAIDLAFRQVNSSLLTATFEDDKVDFQKISLRNMTISERAMRARSYEAADLKGLLSTHAAGRSIPYFLKIRQGGALKTISGYSGRVVESSERRGIDEVAAWVKSQVRLIQTPPGNKDFLNSFAKFVELEQVLARTAPSAILIESSPLADLLLADETSVFIKARTGRTIPLVGKTREKVISMLEAVYEIDDDLKVIGFKSTCKIKKNTKSITFSSSALQRIKILDNGAEISLQKYIVKNGLYSICFKDPKFMYFMGRCFEDSSGVAEIQSILDILVPKTELINVESEKGAPQEISTSFDGLSIFGQVELIHASDDYVFCDDLGNEWADHITLNDAESCISFIHSKHGERSKSASKLHDVVGQGIKNLGNMWFTKNQAIAKCQDKFSQTYNSGDGVQTQIARVRKGDVTKIDQYLIDLLKKYSLHRKCILVCSFISKSEIEKEFNKIRMGQEVAGYIVQLLWIISSFAHAAKDINVIPVIYCTP